MTRPSVSPWLAQGRIGIRAFLTRGEAPWPRRIRWHRLLVALIASAVAVYTSAVTAAFLFVRHRKMDRVQFGDIALPWRWQNYQVARGDSYMAAAFQFANQGKFREAFMYARAGILLAPAHRGGRLLLFQLLLATRDTVLARRTLLDGLQYHGGDANYLRVTFGFLLRQHEDAEIVKLARQRLPLPATQDVAEVIALAAATACHACGNFADAEDFLRQIPHRYQSKDARLLSARIARDGGIPALALVQLDGLTQDFPDDLEVHREWVAQQRAMGLADQARRATIAFQLAHPDLPAARVATAAIYRDNGDRARLAQEVGAILRDFGDDDETLTALADVAIEGGDVPLIRRIASHEAGRRTPPEHFDLLVAETLLVARDYAGALETLRTHSSPTAGDPTAALADSLLAIAYHGLGDTATARVFLNRFLDGQNLRVESVLAAANRLVAAGGVESARTALLRAAEIDPAYPAIWARLVELDLALNRVEDLAPHVEQLVRLRRPSIDLLRVTQQKLGSDLFLFSRESPVALEVVRAALAERKASEHL
jgi:tetratricopeptide (TPR) repeat protein